MSIIFCPKLFFATLSHPYSSNPICHHPFTLIYSSFFCFLFLLCFSVTSVLSRSGLFWDVAQPRTVIPCQCFVAKYRSHLQGTSILRRMANPWRQARHFVPKCRYGITILNCVTSQKSADHIYMVAETWSHVLFCGLSPSNIKACPRHFNLLTLSTVKISPWRWPECRQKRVGENIVNKIHINI